MNGELKQLKLGLMLDKGAGEKLKANKCPYAYVEVYSDVSTGLVEWDMRKKDHLFAEQPSETFGFINKRDFKNRSAGMKPPGCHALPNQKGRPVSTTHRRYNLRLLGP